MGKIKKAARQYSFRVEPSPSGGWTVWFPDLPGCSGWARDWQSIGTEARTLARLWLKSERRRQHPIPEPSPETDNLWPRSAYRVMVEDYGPAIGVPDMAKRIGISKAALRTIARKHGVGRTFDDLLLFLESDIERLRSLTPGRPRTVALAAD